MFIDTLDLLNYIIYYIIIILPVIDLDYLGLFLGTDFGFTLVLVDFLLLFLLFIRL